MGNLTSLPNDLSNVLCSPVACLVGGCRYILLPEFEELDDNLLGYASYYFDADPIFIINAALSGVERLVSFVLESLLEQRHMELEASPGLGQPGWLPALYRVEGVVRQYSFTPPQPVRVIG